MTVMVSVEVAPALALESAPCAICGGVDGEPVGVGEDFEYRCAPDAFLALRCERCELVRLDPRPAASELGRIYPDSYHAFAFTAESFGVVHRVRERLEARRMLRAARHVPAAGRILDVGCGDGFHLDLLRRFGPPGWTLHGVDLDQRAVQRARGRGLEVFETSVHGTELQDASYDLVLLIQTIEHVDDPVAVLRSIRRLLRPGGRVLIVTDNTGSPDFTLHRRRHWGGYHFPRHWYLFNRASLQRAMTAAGLDVATMATMTSPVNWTYSVRNRLDDLGAPRWLVNQFSLSAPLALAVFTVFDALLTACGFGALLRAEGRRP